MNNENNKLKSYIFSTGGMRLTKSGDDEEANEKLNRVLNNIQDEGYEIVDIKMNTALGGMGQTIVRFLVTYK